nr:hypothetical protein [Tanacetum cinerariifolium]
ESSHIVAPPTCYVEESEGSGTSDARSMSSYSTMPLSPDHPLAHTTPVLVPILRRTARMAMHVPPVMSHGLSADDESYGLDDESHGVDDESRGLEDDGRAPPTCHVKESEGSGTFGARSMSSDSTAPLLPDHPLTYTTPILVPILRRTARMAVHV